MLGSVQVVGTLFGKSFTKTLCFHGALKCLGRKASVTVACGDIEALVAVVVNSTLVLPLVMDARIGHLFM